MHSKSTNDATELFHPQVLTQPTLLKDDEVDENDVYKEDFHKVDEVRSIIHTRRNE